MNYQGTWPGGTQIRFRTLSWKEFNRLRAITPKSLRNLEVYKACLLAGPSPETVPAGVPAWIGIEQIDRSPFADQFKILQQYLQLGRGWLGSSYISQAQALVAGTLHYTIEQVEDMDPEVFFKRLAAAEMLMGKSLDPADPAKSAKDNQEDAFERENRLRTEAKKQARGDMARKIADRRSRWKQ